MTNMTYGELKEKEVRILKRKEQAFRQHLELYYPRVLKAWKMSMMDQTFTTFVMWTEQGFKLKIITSVLFLYEEGKNPMYSVQKAKADELNLMGYHYWVIDEKLGGVSVSQSKRDVPYSDIYEVYSKVAHVLNDILVKSGKEYKPCQELLVLDRAQLH